MLAWDLIGLMSRFWSVIIALIENHVFLPENTPELKITSKVGFF